MVSDSHSDSMTDALEAVTPEIVTDKKETRGRPKGSKTSKAVLNRKRQVKVLELAAKGISQPEIAAVTGISKQAVNKLLTEFQPIFTELQNVEKYRTVRGDLLDAAEFMALKSAVDPGKHDRAQLQHVAFTLRQLHDMRRLHHNLSTANTQTQTVAITINPASFED